MGVGFLGVGLQGPRDFEGFFLVEFWIFEASESGSVGVGAFSSVGSVHLGCGSFPVLGSFGVKLLWHLASSRGAQATGDDTKACTTLRTLNDGN